MEIQLLRADIASLKIDAIVAPSEAHEHASQAVVVTGGNLLARFVIHVRVPDVNDADADAQLRAVTTSALEHADELAVASIGLPAFATTSHGYETGRCARAMIAAALDYRTRARSLQRVVFCPFGAAEYAAFQVALAELQGE